MSCHMKHGNVWKNLNLHSQSFCSRNFLERNSLEKLYIKTQIQDQPMHVVFHVANKQQASLSVVLG